MTSHLSGLHSKVQQEYPMALFAHLAILNLVLSQVLKSTLNVIHFLEL